MQPDSQPISPKPAARSAAPSANEFLLAGHFIALLERLAEAGPRPHEAVRSFVEGLEIAFPLSGYEFLAGSGEHSARGERSAHAARFQLGVRKRTLGELLLYAPQPWDPSQAQLLRELVWSLVYPLYAAAAPNGKISSGARRLRQWVADLPLADVGDSARALYAALAQLAGESLPGRARVEALEVLRPPAAFVCSELRRRIRRESDPFGAKVRRLALTAVLLHHRLLAGYRDGFDALPAGSGLGAALARGRRALALHRVLNHAGELVWHLRLAGLHEPATFWDDIHRRFAADGPGLSGRRVAAGGDDTHDVDAEYRRLLLIHRLPPQALRPEELEAVHGQLARWGDELALAPAACSGEHCRPGPAAACPGAAAGHCFGTSVAALRRTLLERAQQPERGEIAPATLMRLVDVWCGGVQRGEERVEGTRAIRVVVGTAGAAHYLSRLHRRVTRLVPKPRTPAASPGQGLALDPLAGGGAFLAEVDKQDVWEMVYAAPEQAEQSWATGVDVDAVHAPADGELLDRSAHGCRVRLPPEQLDRARVGELIALRVEGDAERWQVGVIRWLERREGQQLAGVRLLFEAPQPATIRLHSSDGRVSRLPALLGELQGRSAVVFPTLPHLHRRVLDLEGADGKRYRLDPGARLLDSGRVLVLECPTPEPAEAAAVPVEHQEGVWDRL